jgi:phosphatidylethanolamine/phosphatidyl-N-methylethanolamine N-methyltransferase
MPAPVSHRVYDFYGRFYDAFEGLFRRRLQAAIAAAPFRPGDRVLDIGIGTGLSLDHYPSSVHVTGIDLSPTMLRQARRKLARGLVRSIARPSDTVLLQADALSLPFPDASFNLVFLSHVITTVADPRRCFAQALRVAREDATLILVNHFRSRFPLLAWVESAIDPICRQLGWRCDLSLEHLFTSFNVQGRHRTRFIRGKIFQIVYLQKSHGALRLVPVPGLTPPRPVRVSPLGGSPVF